MGHSVVFMTVQRGRAGEFQPGAMLRRLRMTSMANSIWNDWVGAGDASFVGNGSGRAVRLLRRVRQEDRNRRPRHRRYGQPQFGGVERFRETDLRQGRRPPRGGAGRSRSAC